ncbi:MAG: TonB-dependent receptor [Pseudomonadota bacterium]
MKPVLPRVRLLTLLIRSATVAACAALPIVAANAAEESVEQLDTFVTEEAVSDNLGMLPTEPVDSIFGFGKTLLETPRSATTISAEMMERYAITDIDDLVVMSPGAFTQSFFGVAGALDVRGTPGEVYFRGVRRLDNPGNYPTPIGASDRIDIVRGPASPIYGPAKIGGYLNFVPKSARAETGQYLSAPTGEVSTTVGSWGKKIVTGEVGGPATVFGKRTGYYVYSEFEDSDSYYDNTATEQTVIQASFNMELSETSRIEFGGMYHDYDGNQVAGWNRLTQELIDNGTYVTGTAQPLDSNGDGFISHLEYGMGAGGAGMDKFTVGTASVTDADIPAAFALRNVGTTKLDGSQVLVGADDKLANEVNTLYFDYVYDPGSFTITNKLFYEGYENVNDNAYGFSQFHDSSVIEDQLVLAFAKEMDGMKASFQLSPSYRVTDFEHADDYSNEQFDRRDLTMPSTALDRRLLATQIDDDYTEYYYGDYSDIGLAAMADLDFENGLGITLGVRQDFIDVESNTPVDKLLCPVIDGGGNFLSLSANYFGIGCSDAIPFAEDDTEGTSWTASLSYTFPFGITPYATASEQYTLIAGQGAEVTVGNILGGGYFDTSELFEIGVKGSLLNDSLYFALSTFEQTRTDYSAQSIVTNQSAETTGTEFEVRYVVTNSLTLTAGYTDIEVLNLNTEQAGAVFSFFGADDLVNISNPALVYGGQVIGIAFNAPQDGALTAGIPDQSYSMSASYDFLNGFIASASMFHADETPSGHTRVVTLPSYTVFNAGVSYHTDNWNLSLTAKNLTDEEYFRSNFPSLFGSQIVLPELPRNWVGSFAYKF